VVHFEADTSSFTDSCDLPTGVDDTFKIVGPVSPSDAQIYLNPSILFVRSFFSQGFPVKEYTFPGIDPSTTLTYDFISLNPDHVLAIDYDNTHYAAIAQFMLQTLTSRR
jgi:hypothetical protein